MAPYENIAKRKADKQRLEFALGLIDVESDIMSFIAERLQWEEGAEYRQIFAGSFNICLKVNRLGSDEHVIIRFACPGKIHGPWRDEKVRREVMAMTYIREQTSIPVPAVRCWGLTEESPGQIGPFIVMDFVEGDDLARFLSKPTEDKSTPVLLDEDIDNGKLDTIYEQIAGFMLELSRPQFPRIGSLSKDVSVGGWAVTEPPLTYDMNEVVTVGGCPDGIFAAAEAPPFGRSEDFFTACAKAFNAHVRTQRNIAGDDEDLAWKQFTARRCFEKLIPQYGTVDNSGPFRLFCDDLRPGNMLVDPETMRITAVLDFEFTNVMPPQYSQDVPWSLLLQHPGHWLREDNVEEFLRLFEPRKDQFIRAMERAEKKSTISEGPRLSDLMRESWESKQFWFNLASRCSLDVDDIYWQTLHREGWGEDMLDSREKAEKQNFIQQKMCQFADYERELSLMGDK